MVKVWNVELCRVMVFLDFKVCYFMDLNSWFSRSSKKKALNQKKVVESVGHEPATIGLRAEPLTTDLLREQHCSGAPPEAEGVLPSDLEPLVLITSFPSF